MFDNMSREKCTKCSKQVSRKEFLETCVNSDEKIFERLETQFE